MFPQKALPLISASAALFRREVMFSRRHFVTTQQLKQNIKHYTPNNLEKRFLVWSGKYKTMSDIPSHVSYEEMERCRNKVRIRVANIMIVLTVIGCCAMVYSGKQAVKRGESVTQQNLDWHRNYNDSIGKTKEG